MSDKILEVRDLKISFKTPGGLVKAVRDINFELYRGETLAIVGESGSGKSVTSRAVLGISAGNAVVESGEIIFDGQDLLKIGEDDFHNIRGEKISMIFQDPLSSLNPIVKIGRQLTEAMIIKGKTNRKKSRKEFNERLALLKRFMDKADNAPKGSEDELKNAARVKKFDTFEYKHIELEEAYNDAKAAIVEAVDTIDYFLLTLEKEAAKHPERTCAEIKRLVHAAVNPYVVKDGERVKIFTDRITAAVSDPAALAPLIREIKEILLEADALPAPDFFAYAYYTVFSGRPFPAEMSVPEANKFTRDYLEEEFLHDFTDAATKAVKFSADEAVLKKATAVDKLGSFKEFLHASFDESEILKRGRELSDAVEAGIDPLALKKDSIAYTFRGGFTSAIKAYFDAGKDNKKEEARFKKEEERYARIKAAGKVPDFTPVPPSLVSISDVAKSIFKSLDRLEEKYVADMKAASAFDPGAAAAATIEFLKTTAASVVRKISKNLAKIKAIKLMEEVGIPEPRKRYNQYPFQFSGGMRQRIVIAIALSAQPDILVCDEPTTALDVTIQAQILELINDLKRKRNLSVIFITHDLGVVANMADRIAVMYAGKIVETGTAEDVFYTPAHPYTWALLSSMPDLETTEKLEAIPGTPPNMLFPPKGDAFAARNKYAMKIDFEEQPPLFKISDTHYAATWLLHPDAPKVEIPKMVTERIERNKKLLKKDAPEADGTEKPEKPAAKKTAVRAKKPAVKKPSAVRTVSKTPPKKEGKK